MKIIPIKIVLKNALQRILLEAKSVRRMMKYIIGMLLDNSVLLIVLIQKTQYILIIIITIRLIMI